MDNLVIFPTIRSADFISAYLKNGTRHGFDFSKTEFMVLTEDSVDKSQYKNVFNEWGVENRVLNQQDRDREMSELHLSKYSELFPKKHRAEESFALLYMWLHDHKYGFTVDDDTLPVEDFNFFGEHIKNLNFKGKIREYKSNKNFVNVLHHSFRTMGLYPRGYPYGAMGETLSFEEAIISNVGISQGLWTNVPDLDAVRILFDGDLNGQSKTRMRIEDFGENFTVAKANYVTVCSMNVAFKREILPAFYQYKMGDNPWKIDRFDDIWSGVVVKKFMDSQGYSIINGTPLCHHNKAPRSTFKDLKVEIAGLEANEVFYKTVDSVSTKDTDPLGVVMAIAERLTKSDHEFIAYCGKHLQLWIEMLSKVQR